MKVRVLLNKQKNIYLIIYQKITTNGIYLLVTILTYILKTTKNIFIQVKQSFAYKYSKSSHLFKMNKFLEVNNKIFQPRIDLLNHIYK